jgi:hypothetical protein
MKRIGITDDKYWIKGLDDIFKQYKNLNTTTAQI